MPQNGDDCPWLTAPDQTPNSDRAEFWRAYTASMLFQNAELQQSLSSAPEYEDQVVGLASLLYKLQAIPVGIEEGPYYSLREIITTARTLTAQFRCQRGCVYEVDASVVVGDVYDDTKMTDIRYDEDDGGSDDGGDDDVADRDAGDDGPRPRHRKKVLLVTSVIANAIIKRPAPRSPHVDAYLSKALVTVLPEQGFSLC